MTHVSEYEIDKKVEATIENSTRITRESSPEEVRDIQLRVDGTLDCSLGMTVGVLVPGPHPFGNPTHLRLYSIADLVEDKDGQRITICVKRCTYIDEISGEEYNGIASNYLCDRVPGSTITLTGPYPSPFAMPPDTDANILMIAQGTGIAPFRALVRKIYEDKGGWNGQVRLFYGARSGLEMLYMNDERNDFVNYYDTATFQAFQAVSPRPHMGDPVALGEALGNEREMVWTMLRDPDTFVYVSGVTGMIENLDEAFSQMAGSEEKWQRLLAELKAGGRWQEIRY